jgi:cytochrome bd ubiquinol oxidase subunit II
MVPLWEANHIGIIIAVVIVFVVFPPIFNHIATFLLIPLVIMFAGIVLRECAVILKHFGINKIFPQDINLKIYSYSRLIVTFSFGLIAGSLVSGRITPIPKNIIEIYISPWFN